MYQPVATATRYRMSGHQTRRVPWDHNMYPSAALPGQWAPRKIRSMEQHGGVGEVLREAAAEP